VRRRVEGAKFFTFKQTNVQKRVGTINFKGSPVASLRALIARTMSDIDRGD